MPSQNVTVHNVDQGEECHIDITETDKALTIVIHDHLKVAGITTKNGNRTIATTHGNIMTGKGQNLSINLWERGQTGAPRRNVTIK